MKVRPIVNRLIKPLVPTLVNRIGDSEPPIPPPVTSTIWRLLATNSNGAFSASEIRFLSEVGAANEAEGGTSASSIAAIGAFVPANAWDANNGTFMALNLSGGQSWVDRTFNAPVSVEEVLIRSRSDGFTTQTPSNFVVQYWNGSAFVDHFWVATTPFGLGETRRFAKADWYSAGDDEPGGHRFWFIKINANQNGVGEIGMSEVKLRLGSTDRTVQRRGITFDLAPSDTQAWFDGSIATYAHWGAANHWICVDFGRAVNIDNIQFTSRNDSTTWAYQMPDNGEVRYGDTAVFANSVLDWAWDDTAGVPSVVGVTRTHARP